MQGTWNDFLLVEADRADAPPGAASGRPYRTWNDIAVAICERHFGVGADGLMLVLPSERADVGMRLFNADGSEAEVSGNGVRCLVKYAVDRGIARPAKGRVTIEA